MNRLPVIDMRPLFEGNAAAQRSVAQALRQACRNWGFFYISGHGIASETLASLDRAARAFFALPEAEKQAVAMARGGPAWRGYFPLGGELTSGRADRKAGLYFGRDLRAGHPRVAAGWPLHGANLWPERPAALRPAVEEYMAGAERAGQALLRGMALSLNLEADYFQRHYTKDPTVLFRIFHYPAEPEAGPADWGVGEHSDYGLLTLLAQDDCGGLEVKGPGGWIEAPPLPGTLVCNIGDMLDRLTGGWYRSTPHRVRNRSGRDRLSFPFFFDPDFAAEMKPLPRAAQMGDGGAGAPRWDGADLRAFEGTYGDYLLGKVSKVFPELRERVL